jgi:hypothetical protein
MTEPLEGHLVQRVPWREPITVTERQRAVDFGMSLAEALATLRRMDDATRALAEAIAVEQRLVERVPQGCHVDRSAVFVSQGKLTVDVAFSSGPEPEQLEALERDEVLVDHPAGEVVVPIERARVAIDVGNGETVDGEIIGERTSSNRDPEPRRIW